jgi:hypothetical protein
MTLTIPRDEGNRKIFRSKELQHALQNPCRMEIAGFQVPSRKWIP